MQISDSIPHISKQQMDQIGNHQEIRKYFDINENKTYCTYETQWNDSFPHEASIAAGRN